MVEKKEKRIHRKRTEKRKVAAENYNKSKVKLQTLMKKVEQ